MQASTSTKYQPYSLRRGTSQEQTKKRTEKQISFTSAIETLAILSPPPDAESRDAFPPFGASSSAMMKVSKNQSKFRSQIKIKPVDLAADIQDCFVDSLSSPIQETTVWETIPSPKDAIVEENAVDAKAQCTVTHLNSATSGWAGSSGSVKIGSDHTLSYWRLRSTTSAKGYIFADESSGSVKYVVYKGNGENLMFVPQSNLSNYPAPESVDIDNASNDPRVFLLDSQNTGNAQGFLMPSSDKSLSVKLDGTTVKLATHVAATADEWVISTV